MNKLILLVLPLLLSGCIYKVESNKQEVKVETQRVGTTMILQFSADWCGPCRQLKATIKDKDIQKAISDNHEDWEIIDIDNPTPRQQKLIDQFKPRSIPLVVMVEIDGDSVNEVKSFTGARNKSFLLEWLR